MKKKIILIFTMLCMLFLLPSCSKKYVSLEDGAVVNLTIKSDASEVFVNTNYGEVQKNSTYSFTINIPSIKTFNISVSADGYATNNYVVNSKDLETGTLDIKIDLVQKELKYLTFKLNEDYQNLKCVNNRGEKLADLKDGKFSFSLDKDQIKNDIIIKADGMEDYKVKLNSDELNATYISRDFILTKKGTKLISFYSTYSELYATYESGEFIKLKSASTYDYQGRTRFLSVDKNYIGKILLRVPTYGNKHIYLEVNENTPTYGDLLYIKSEENNNYYETNRVTIEECYSNYDFYRTNEDGSLMRLYIDYDEKDPYINLPNNCKIFAFLENKPYSQYDYKNETVINLNSFSPCDEYLNNEVTCLLVDNFLKKPINGTIIETYNKDGIQKTNKIPTKDCYFKLRDNSFYPNYSLEDGTYVYIDKNTFYYKNDVLYCPAQVNYEYGLKFTTCVNNETIKFDSLSVNSQKIDKTSTGDYEYHINYNEKLTFIGKIKDKLYLAIIDDLSSVEFDSKTHIATLKINFKSKIGNIIQVISENGKRIRVNSLTCEDKTVVFNNVESYDPTYYLYAESDLKVNIKINYFDDEEMKQIEKTYLFDYAYLIENSADFIVISI